MRHRKRVAKLHRRLGARQALLRGLAASVLLHERVRTTAGRARAVRPFVEKCITIGREPSLVARRALLASLGDRRAVAKILEVIGPKYRTRSGGYTRVTPGARRVGDGAQEVIVELV
jgi:large subunit ribosomal protein L17